MERYEGISRVRAPWRVERRMGTGYAGWPSGPLERWERARMNRLAKEYRVFRACSRQMRVLLLTNILFTLVLPVVDIFVAAYVMRNSHDVGLVVSFQLAVYTGIPIAFLLNGFLLGRVRIQRLYSLGMLLIGLSMLATMAPEFRGPWGIAAAGLFLGLAYGLFAANRAMLALRTTNDGNRNYYYGVEMFFYTGAAVLVPLAVGGMIEGASRQGWFGGTRNSAYQAVAVFVCALTAAATLVFHQAIYPDPQQTRFLYLRFNPLWYKMLWLGALKGLAQGYIVTAPAMLILLLVGQEGTLGVVQGTGGVLAAFLLYGVGRWAEPRHRLHVFAAGLLLFLLAGIVNAVLFNALGVIVLAVCLLLAKPLLDLAYFPIQFRVTEVVAEAEGRGAYAYIFNHECAEYAGRLMGCGLFLVMDAFVSDVAALKYALPVVGAVQLFSLAIARPLLERVPKLGR
jgi:YQGE family putative transporter